MITNARYVSGDVVFRQRAREEFEGVLIVVDGIDGPTLGGVMRQILTDQIIKRWDGLHGGPPYASSQPMW